MNESRAVKLESNPPQEPSRSSHQPISASRVAGVCFLLLSLSACVSIDPEYSQKLASARSDTKGNEIVGVWVSKINPGLNPFYTISTGKFTLLFRPDGTGRIRIALDDRAPFENSLAWTYLGSGQWEAHNTANDIDSFEMKYNGHDLLMHLHSKTVWWGPNPSSGTDEYMVLIPAGDSGALQEYLKLR